MKTISIILPCFNEQENIYSVYNQVSAVFASLANEYEYELVFIDNCSVDNTRAIIKEIAAKDKKVKAIFNAKNFGHIRSPYYGLTQAKGDAAILMATDLQDPPTLITDFIKYWEQGYKIVIGQKTRSKEGIIIKMCRKVYYKLIKKITDINHIEQFTGFGLYDQDFIKVLAKLNDPYPYFRGIIAELGYPYKSVSFTQPNRQQGKSKNNFSSLYDMAMLGITSYSKTPLRKATIWGFIIFWLGFLTLISQLTFKILNYYQIVADFWLLSLQITGIIILFMIAGALTFISGLIGEYVMMINTRMLQRPLVIEEERINFDE